MYYKRNIQQPSRNDSCRSKAISTLITYSQCVFIALVTQHAKGMRRDTLSPVSCLALLFSSHYDTKVAIFGGNKYWIQNLFWFSLQLLSETFLILRRIQRDMMKNVNTSSCKNVKVKVTLVQALRLCTGRTAHRGTRGIALLFHDQRH